MPRIAYVNGSYVLHGHASIHVEDRGYQFSDGIYEVWGVVDGRMIDADGHMARLVRSLGELRIGLPMSLGALRIVLKQVVRRNRLKDGLVYLQVTRGVARRDHAFPLSAPAPGLVITAKSIDPSAQELKAERGIAVVSVPDNRWGRCDIKTVGLLPNVLAKQTAVEQGAGEAWLVAADGCVTEGASTNAWILDRDGVLRTRDTRANILGGITRSTLIRVIERLGLAFDPRPFTIEEAQGAREAFITSATSWVTPVVQIDGKVIANGVPGETALRLRQLYRDEACISTI